MITGGAVVAPDEDERAEDWHRSSLNSDDDPPHMRFVTVIQVTDTTILVHLDDNDTPAQHSSAAVPSTAEPPEIPSNPAPVKTPTRIASLPVAVILSFQGLVHTTVSPEHAAATESVIQTTLQSLSLTGR